MGNEHAIEMTQRARVRLYSEGLQGGDRELTGVEMIDSLQEALTETISNAKSKSVAIIPEGPYVVPRLVA